MPNKKAAIKSLRQDKKKHSRNKAVMSELRTIAKNAKVLIIDNKRDEANSILKKLESKLDRAAKNNIIKKNNAARKVSRLRSQWSKIEASK
ncbi:MAG: 30S ribosomal protein S20 [Candidatus Omnitrophota bacterium]|nr:30S ribosomal protein S20 [Candidatus Omnitrophota bacterium]MBU1894677.1 30S ribosomal protein S20 [Candidatus Omnitrophota bacterium]